MQTTKFAVESRASNLSGVWGHMLEQLVESWQINHRVTLLIAHESHHRGSILLTLKQTGHKLTDELKWGLWDWNKL